MLNGDLHEPIQKQVKALLALFCSVEKVVLAWKLREIQIAILDFELSDR